MNFCVLTLQSIRPEKVYISRLKRFRNAEYLTRQMCLELIDSVTVDEFERGKQERDIHIYYKFIDKGYTGKSDE